MYLAIVVVMFFLKRGDYDLSIFIFGFVAMIVSEFFFVSSGAEVFVRTSLFGIMPIWLPFLWGYAFVAIKRSVRVLEN